MMNTHFLRLLISMLLLVPNTTNFAQTVSSLEGRWKMITMSDKEFTGNFETDSFSFPNKPVISSDSSTIADVLAAFGKTLGSIIYIFGKSGSFEYLQNNESDGKGTYSIDRKTGILTTIVTRNNVIAKEQMKYSLKSNQLTLFPMDEDLPVVLTFERITEKMK